MILWSQSLTSRSYPAFRENDHFVVNILADDRGAVSDHFSRAGKDEFQAIDYDDGLCGSPVLPGAAAYLG